VPTLPCSPTTDRHLDGNDSVGSNTHISAIDHTLCVTHSRAASHPKWKCARAARDVNALSVGQWTSRLAGPSTATTPPRSTRRPPQRPGGTQIARQGSFLIPVASTLASLELLVVATRVVTLIWNPGCRHFAPPAPRLIDIDIPRRVTGVFCFYYRTQFEQPSVSPDLDAATIFRIICICSNIIFCKIARKRRPALSNSARRISQCIADRKTAADFHPDAL